jgi:hypothetical protein
MWSVHMPSTVRQPLARPKSAVGWCWKAAWRPQASRIHKIDALYGGPPISGADSLARCSQNRFWYPKLPPPARLARMGVRKRILHPRRPKIVCYGLTRRQKIPKHPKTLLNHPVRNGVWMPQVAARRSNTAPRPIRAAPMVGAPSEASGRTTYAVRYHPLALEPRLRCVFAEGVLFTPKIRCAI